MNSTDPIRVAILDDVDLVARGLEQMCKRATRGFQVHSISSDATAPDPVDIVLYDGFTAMHEAPHNAAELLRIAHASHLVIYSWNVKPVLVDAALRGGASGYLDKRLGFAELVDALEHIHNGHQVVRVCPPPVRVSEVPSPSARRPADLTEREVEIVTLIAQGLSNQEIGERLFLSINTIKSYIRMAYRKMNVCTRSQAVLWALDHGLRTDPGWDGDWRVAG